MYSGGVCVCACVCCEYVGHGGGRAERGQAYCQVKMGRSRTGGDRPGGGPGGQRNCTSEGMEIRKSRENVCEGGEG